MQKSLFHNGKSISEKKDKNKSVYLSSNINIKRVVDMNILLNRVKIEERNEIKKKIIFFGLVTLGLCLFGTFMMIAT